MGDKQVGPAIAVVVAKGRTGRPAGINAQPCLIGYIGEGAIVIVAVKGHSAKAGDQQIGPAVVVVVSDGRSHGPAGIADSGLFGHIGKGAVVVVVVKRAPRFAAGQRHVDAGGIGKVNVGPAVAVIVDERDSTAHRLHDVLLGRGRQMIKLNFRGAGDVDELGNLRVRRRRGLIGWSRGRVLGSAGMRGAEDCEQDA